MNFLKKHYEKIILAVFLLVFIVSLVLLIFALSKSMDIKEEELRFPTKAPDYKKINIDEINYKKTLEAEKKWNPGAPRVQGDKNFTDLLAPYAISRCPNSDCRKLIPASSFVDNGSCPLCRGPLRAIEGSGPVDPNVIDSNRNGIPDVVEKELGLDPTDPDSAEKTDPSGFTYAEKLNELRLRKLPSAEMGKYLKDPKFHPAYAKRLYIESIKRSMLPIKLIKVTPHGEDTKTWTIQMDETMPNGSVKTRFYKQGNVLTFNERKYEIKNIKFEIIEEKVDRRENSQTIKKTVYNITLQEEDGSMITGTEKKEIWESKENAKIVDRFTNKEYMVSVNEDIAVGDSKAGEEKYKVKIINSAKKKVVLLRLSDNTEYELLPGERKENVPAAVNPGMPPGAMPPGAMPPGAMPPGAMQPGAMQPVMPPVE
ncbi:MAG TPA: hypothetical protein DCZ94_00280 [Lentisphaeria bacterium]|nr:MAG: hypothetical protein A2X48_18775 [Lentisphaerae bacterium GWF2_49_21]HBC85369.1 hypothetical protein [Lentisphaeria bacterium]